MHKIGSGSGGNGRGRVRKIAEEVEALAEEKKMQRKVQSTKPSSQKPKSPFQKRTAREILTGLLGDELKISFTGEESLQVTVITNKKNHVP